MTPRHPQRRLRRYIDHPAGPTWRDLDGAPRYDGPVRYPAPPPAPYEQMPQRPPIQKPSTENKPRSNAA